MLLNFLHTPIGNLADRIRDYPDSPSLVVIVDEAGKVVVLSADSEDFPGAVLIDDLDESVGEWWERVHGSHDSSELAVAAG